MLSFHIIMHRRATASPPTKPGKKTPLQWRMAREYEERRQKEMKMEKEKRRRE
jgi:hypothetical protein